MGSINLRIDDELKAGSYAALEKFAKGMRYLDA